MECPPVILTCVMETLAHTHCGVRIAGCVQMKPEDEDEDDSGLDLDPQQQGKCVVLNTILLPSAVQIKSGLKHTHSRCLISLLCPQMKPEDEDEDDSGLDLDPQRQGKCVVLKTSTRQTIFLPVVGLVDANSLKPSDLVGVNKDSYLILDTLPAEYDSRVKAMEVGQHSWLLCADAAQVAALHVCSSPAIWWRGQGQLPHPGHAAGRVRLVRQGHGDEQLEIKCSVRLHVWSDRRLLAQAQQHGGREQGQLPHPRHASSGVRLACQGHGGEQLL